MMSDYWHWITHEPGQLGIFITGVLGLILGIVAILLLCLGVR